jgi:hypothetical protein
VLFELVNLMHFISFLLAALGILVISTALKNYLFYGIMSCTHLNVLSPLTIFCEIDPFCRFGNWAFWRRVVNNIF